MSVHKLLFLNLGYARGIDGSLLGHLRYAHRHFYCPPHVQSRALNFLKQLIADENPDICCLVEIDQGMTGARRFNQLDALTGDVFAFSDIENKYGQGSLLRSLPLTSGKSNGFVARRFYVFEKIFFTCGTKRLVYKIRLDDRMTLFFAHFSLKQSVRARQLLEARDLMRREAGESIFLGDFNILSGLEEITPLLDGGRFTLLNKRDMPTFFFHKQKHVLDLCICSPTLAERAQLAVRPQSYTDHAALILEIR